MTAQTWGIVARAVLAALALAVGIWLVCDALVFSRTRRLGDRIAAQLRPVAGSRDASAPMLARLWPMSAGHRRGLEQRLAAAGRPPDALAHRAATVLWCSGAVLVLAVVFAAAASVGTLRAVPAAIVFVAVPVGVLMWRSTSLTRAATRRRRVLTAQFPLLADLLALGVAAGEAVAPALQRAARETGGELGPLVMEAVKRSETGVPLSTALRELATRARINALDDCVEAILIAGERGTPLAPLLRDQATDARELERRNLLEAGGKAEIRMMVPVVFGILPLSVLFAIFPSIDLLSLSL
jgi:tight adherence protein C